MTVVDPTIAGREVTVGKLIALFDRAEARDFVDVFEFCQRYEPALLLELAVHLDAGLVPQDLAKRVRRLTEQLTEADLPTAYQDRFEEIRSFYAGWRRSCSVDLGGDGAAARHGLPGDVQTDG